MKIILFVFLSFVFYHNTFGQEQEIPELFVFIGEKIYVIESEQDPDEDNLLMDYVFKAKYKILEMVYNDLQMDTIEFTVYDHHGIPAFSKYQFVLLYLIQIDGEFYHEKYQYSDLYKTKDNKWASRYQAYDYNHLYNQHTSIKPEIIDFKENIFFNIENLSIQDINKWFPEPYYKIENNKAIAVYGNYINELFQLKKNGILKARGYFK